MTVEKKNYNPFYLDAHHHREQFFQTLSLSLPLCINLEMVLICMENNTVLLLFYEK